MHYTVFQVFWSHMIVVHDKQTEKSLFTDDLVVFCPFESLTAPGGTFLSVFLYGIIFAV